ncbi:DUF3265 domain-containing protein [Vibrio coralliilyticus]|nr:DUF3265 domain-containing protein [Vibrio coralliilyticus]NOH54980.1 DUF3265 domain-containing protein [Vibrio coralliilyticus]
MYITICLRVIRNAWHSCSVLRCSSLNRTLVSSEV